MIDIEEQYLNIIKTILDTYFPQHEVWAFGSRVIGQSHDGSDLDLVVVSKIAPEISIDLSAIKAAFSESNLPMMIDIIDWAAIPESFRERIKQQAVMIKK